MKMDNNICAICLDSLFDENEPICSSQAPCGHIFHTHCILNWLNSHVNGLCPLCREIVYEGDLIPVRVPPTPPEAHWQRVYIWRQEQVSDSDYSEEVEEEEAEDEETTISPRNQHLENEDANLDSNSKYSWLLNQFRKSRLWPLMLKPFRKCLEWLYLAIADGYMSPLFLLKCAIGCWYFGMCYFCCRWGSRLDDEKGIPWKDLWNVMTDNGLERNNKAKYFCNWVLTRIINMTHGS